MKPDSAMKMHDYFTWHLAYAKGYRPPRYKLPAIPVKTGYQPSGAGVMAGVAYIWLTSGPDRLTTFWKGLGYVEEWYEHVPFFRRRRRFVQLMPREKR